MRRRLALILLALTLVASGCGDDDDTDDASGSGSASEPAAAGDADLATYCEKSIEIETLPEPDIDFENASEEEIAEGLKTYAAEEVVPVAEEIEKVAPEEIAAEVEVLIGATRELAETGDFEAAFGTPEVKEAEATVHAFDLASCDIASTDVTAVEYAFEGLPAAMEAGVMSFELTNGGEEPHELVLFRKNDGVTESIDDILALGEEEAQSKMTAVAGTFAEPGGDAYAIVDLESGDYAAVCFVPVGGGDEGPPHFTEGMKSEFTVE